MKKRDKILMCLFAILQIVLIVLGIFECVDWLIAISPICVLLIILTWKQSKIQNNQNP